MRSERSIWLALVALLLAAGLFITNIIVLQNQTARSEDQLNEIATAIKDDNQAMLTQVAAAQPMTGPLQPPAAQITNIIAEATGNQLTLVAGMTANPVTPDPNAPTSMPFMPWIQPQIDAATQFAVDQAANPALTATIIGCNPGMYLPIFDEEFENQLREQFENAGLAGVRLSLEIHQVTQDCVNFETMSPSLTFVFDREEAVDVEQSLTIIGDVLSQYDAQQFSRIGVQLMRFEVPGPPTSFLQSDGSFEDFHANYEAGLRGLNLLVPNNS